MASERWVSVRDGQLVLVEELDGWSYLRTKERGKQTTWTTPTTLEELARAYGEDSRLVHEARAALSKAERPGSERSADGCTETTA